MKSVPTYPAPTAPAEARGTTIARDIVTADQLADHYGIARSTVYALMKRGMPSLKVGASRRFRLADCDAYFSQNTTAA